MRFSNAQFPGDAGVFNACERRRTGPAAVAGDEDIVGMSLGDTRRDRADSNLGDQFDADSCRGIGVLEVEYQLGEIFDRVNIVMWWRTDESHARRRMPDRRDDLVHLAPGIPPLRRA